MRNSIKQTKRKRVQYGALPYRMRDRARPEVMLVTSRERQRWIIPKGWPSEQLAPHHSAAREALEEGGLVGEIGARSIGSYYYDKRLSDGSSIKCTVEVFALEVLEQLSSWPEQNQRRTQWFTLQEAASVVEEAELTVVAHRSTSSSSCSGSTCAIACLKASSVAACSNVQPSPSGPHCSQTPR